MPYSTLLSVSTSHLQLASSTIISASITTNDDKKGGETLRRSAVNCASEARTVYSIFSVPSIDCFKDVVSRAFTQREALIRVVPNLPSFDSHEPLIMDQFIPSNQLWQTVVGDE